MSPFLPSLTSNAMVEALVASLSPTVPVVSSAPTLDDPSGDHILNPDFATLDATAPLKPAAVLVAVDTSQQEPSVTLTVRTSTLSAHAGQIAFPGGRIDAGENPRDAALREAMEEVALTPSLVKVEGFLPSYASRTGYRVYPVVGTLDGLPPLRANPGEVEHIFHVPLRFLLNDANAQKTSRVFEGKRRYFYTYLYRNYRIWGLTAGIIHHMSKQMRSALGTHEPVQFG